MATFLWEIAKIAQQLGAAPPGPHWVNCYLAHNLHKQQLSKLLLQGFGINKCCNDATITVKPCLTITALTTIGYWLLFEKFKPPPLKISGCTLLERQTGCSIFIHSNHVSFYKVQCAIFAKQFSILILHYHALFPDREMPLQDSRLFPDFSRSWKPWLLPVLKVF